MIFWSCSTNKNTFLSRSVHTTATKYNVLYNGKLAFDKQKELLDNDYKDDFTKIIPIEPLKLKEDKELELSTMPNSKISMPSNSTNKKKFNIEKIGLKKSDLPINNKNNKNNKIEDAQSSTATGFARAEEKAVKAVQKHSINIGSVEKNKQIDDAYFLLGKSRYYDQRFVPALETFKYMIKKYPESELFDKARVWEAKTLIRLGQEEDAVYKLEKQLLKRKKIPNNIKDKAHTALAMAYLKQDSIQQTINNLNKALEYTKKNYNQATRNAFVLAQLYRKQNKIDSSNIVFELISLDKKAPYHFQIYAQIERAKNYNKETDDTISILEQLEKLTKNRDNRPYLDGIFYQIGKIKLANNKPDEAIIYFKKTLRTKMAHNQEKDFAYEQLGNIYFDKASFLKAGAYYDSVLNITKNEKSRRIRKIKRKRKSLDDVIHLEGIVKKNDSLLKLISMSKEEQTNFFNNYIKELKRKEEEAKIIAENQKTSNFSGFGNSGSKQNSAKGSKFYFYNTQTVSFGEQEFKKVWGNRSLNDNWRLSNTSSIYNEEKENKYKIAEDKIDESKKYDVKAYLEKIPSDIVKIDSIKTNRNKAYYKLGVIYKEQFKKPTLSIDKLEKLLSFKPDSKLILPSYYHLYKAYLEINNSKSNYYKNKIIKDFPDSRYTQLITNPNDKENIDKNSPDNIYYNVYCKYEYEDYDKVIKECNKYIKSLDENPIIAKFELLKAQAIGKTTGKEKYIEALTFVVENYPNTDEGKRAQEILDFLKGIEPIKKNKEKQEKTETKNEKIKRKSNFNNKLPSNKKMLERIKKNDKP